VKRALVLAAPLALVLGLGACGDDDDEPDTTESDVTAPADEETDVTLDVSIPDISLPDISLPDLTLPEDITIPDISISGSAEDIVRQIFPNLDDEQVSCLVDAMGTDIDPSQVMDLLDDCNINVSDLAPG
jgi:hypothetical protein